MSQGRTGTWSVGDFLRAVTYANRNNSLATIPKPPAVPLSAPSALSKAGGVAMFGFQGGWMLGQGGLALYASATGTTYENVYCSQSPIYQGLTSVFAFNIGVPDCKVPLENPNGDISPGYTLGPLTIASNWGSWTSSAKTTNTDVYCWQGSLPAGYRVRFSGTAGTSSSTNGIRWGTFTGCDPWPASLAASVVVPATGTVSFRLENGSGQTVANSVQQVANPKRTLSCSIKWEDGTLTTSMGDQYYEETGVPLGASGFGCEQAYVSKPGAGPDLLPDEITVDSTVDGGAKTEISKQQIPDFTEDERKGLDPGDGTGLKLWKITAAGKASCMTWAADCRGWWTKTNSGTEQPPGETYRCEWGGKFVKLAECGVYRRTFDDTETDTGKITDPESGETTDWTTITEGDMNTGLNPGQRCLTEWSEVANPIEFVLQPVKCALVWAFVPRTSVVSATTTGISTAWASSALGAWSNTFTSWSFIPPPAGCDGVEVRIGDVFGHGVSNFRILNACPGDPLQPIAVMSSIVLGIASVVALIWVASGSIGAIVGFRGLNGGGTS